jgi:hypothetical protein
MFETIRQTTSLWAGGQDFVEVDSHNYVTRYSVQDGTMIFFALIAAGILLCRLTIPLVSWLSGTHLLCFDNRVGEKPVSNIDLSAAHNWSSIDPCPPPYVPGTFLPGSKVVTH